MDTDGSTFRSTTRDAASLRGQGIGRALVAAAATHEGMKLQAGGRGEAGTSPGSVPARLRAFYCLEESR